MVGERDLEGFTKGKGLRRLYCDLVGVINDCKLKGFDCTYWLLIKSFDHWLGLQNLCSLNEIKQDGPVGVATGSN